MITQDKRKTIKTALSAFKKAGAPVEDLSEVKIEGDEAKFELVLAGKDTGINVNLSTGDVFVVNFTSKDKIGSTQESGKLQNNIKAKFFTDKEIAPNVEEHEYVMNGTHDSRPGEDDGALKKLKIIIKGMLRKHIEEISTTGTGANFTSGQGEQYATPFAFNKTREKLNRATQNAVKMGWKTVSKGTRFKAKSFDVEKWHE